VERDRAVVQRVAEHGAEPEHQPHRHVEQAVDGPLERRARVAKSPCRAGDARREAPPDRGDPVGAGALDDERTRSHLLPSGAH